MGDRAAAGPRGRLRWVLAAVGTAGAVAAALADPAAAGGAAAQDWSPFVLVGGLLLVGLVADADGVFAGAGHLLARAAPAGPLLYCGAVVLVGLVTAVLNLDTSVAFLTPVLVYTARSRGAGEAPLLYGCLLLSNAGSLFLPGSNLTNLIVLGQLHLTGGQFLARMWAPALAALIVTAVVVAVAERRELCDRPVGGRRPVPEAVRALGRAPAPDAVPALGPRHGLGLAAVAASALLVLFLRQPALAVAAVGVAVAGVRIAARRLRPRQAWEALSAPLLAGLFGVAVALGTLGRVWAGPAELLGHLDAAGTAALAACASVLVNNLPAASLLAARPPAHPLDLLVGLNLGPNLFLTGSLSWILWRRAAMGAGAEPSTWRALRAGLVAVPLAIAVALVALATFG